MNSQKDDKDEFEFSFLAENIANDISSSFDLQTSSPPIINIRGTWGLGKSFLAKQIKENLTAKNIKVVTIDAWLVNDQKGIFKYISSELLSKWQNFHFRLSSIKGAIPKVIQPTIVILLFYFTVLFLYNEIFNVTGCNFPYCVIDLKKVLGYLFQFNAALLSFVFVYLIDKDQREPYQLKKFLKDNYKEKTVVIFDEVDRLEAEQIRYLIMMATDALSLKNICPVLCYDYDVVIKKLKEDDKSDELAQKYLNKIEDRIIYVPHIERHHLEKILDKSLSSVENQIGQLIKPEDIEMILEDNIISGNRRIFFQYIQAIKKKLPILETTINLAEMLSFLLRIEKLKLNNYALYSWILQFVLSEETKRFRSSVFDKDRQENFIPEVLKKEKLFVTSSEEIQRLTKKLLETPQHLINEYYEFTVYGKRKCNLTIIQIENLCEQLVKYNGEDINADQLCEVLQRFNYLLERSKKLSLLKDPFFQAIRTIIFDPYSQIDLRFAKFFNKEIDYMDSQNNAFLLLIRNYNYLLFQSKTHEDICQTIRKDLNDTYDPRIIRELLNHSETSHPHYLRIIQNTFKDNIQNHWLDDLKLGKMLKPAFYQRLWDILALWKSYSLDTEFMTQLIDIYPEMSLLIISDYMSKSRTSSERPYILVEKASVNNEDKILGKIFNIELYNLQDFNNLNTLGIDFKKALYENIKKSIPEELFSLLSRSELDNSRLFFQEELYNKYENAFELYYPSLTHHGVMFCLIYEESKLKA